jgi:hypothetical protein
MADFGREATIRQSKIEFCDSSPYPNWTSSGPDTHRSKIMTHDEFVRWLNDEVQSERMTSLEMGDLLEQKGLFDGARSIFEVEFAQHIVGYVAGRRLITTTIHELIDKAKAEFPDNMIYFEPIGFDLL